MKGRDVFGNGKNAVPQCDESSAILEHAGIIMLFVGLAIYLIISFLVSQGRSV